MQPPIKRTFLFDSITPQRIVTARKAGTCSKVSCHDGIKVGEQIMRNYGGWCHLWCMPRWEGTSAQQALRRWQHKPIPSTNRPLGEPTQPVRTSIPSPRDPRNAPRNPGSTCDCGIFVPAGKESFHSCR